MLTEPIDMCVVFNFIITNKFDIYFQEFNILRDKSPQLYNNVRIQMFSFDVLTLNFEMITRYYLSHYIEFGLMFFALN